jgi:serine/threonine protein kinase
MEALMTTTGGYQSLKGTPYWMAPEVIHVLYFFCLLFCFSILQFTLVLIIYLKVIRQSGYGRQADIWSVGCTVIEMATGKPPFHEITEQVSVLFHIASSNAPPPIPAHLSPAAQDFLLKCFERYVVCGWLGCGCVVRVGVSMSNQQTNRNPINRPNARVLLEHPFLKEEGRKSSGNSSGGFSSPKTSHSFGSPRKFVPPSLSLFPSCFLSSSLFVSLPFRSTTLLTYLQ